MRVLFVEDDSDLREIMAETVAALGHELLAAGSLAEVQAHAEDALASRLAILDVNLGAGAPSGVDACRWLRTRRFCGRVVFLTGHARSSPLVEEALRVGSSGQGLFEKPITLDQLKALLVEAGDGRS
jgi:CheY-like chemotaxis protein